MKEDDVITMIRDMAPSFSKGVKLSIGDDGSVVEIEKGMELVTVLDSMTLGTHYLPQTTPDSIGHKIFAVNLSDMAAMGAKPKWAHLSLSLPQADKSWIEKFIKGASVLAAKHDLAIIGGDTIQGPEMISLSIQGLVKKSKYITRTNAKTGDLVYVTGHLGSAAFGLHLLKLGKNKPTEFIQAYDFPEPRVGEGIFLSNYASSMIDISDGLHADLSKLTKASNVGFNVSINQLPIRKDMFDHFNPDEAISMTLSGGDDYELCFTIPQKMKDGFEQKWNEKFNTRLSHIGEITESTSGYKYNGDDYKIETKNFEHF